MKLQEIRALAREKGMRSGELKKGDLIRAIQREEGNFDCYGSATTGFSNRNNCFWKKRLHGGFSALISYLKHMKI